jgi:hypothetical protein
MRRFWMTLFFLTFAVDVAQACYDETSVRCSSTERNVKVRSSGATGPFGESLGYFEYARNCASAAILDTVRCPGEYVIDGVRWTKEKARSYLEDLGYDANGVKLDVKPVGATKDLSGLRKEVLKLKPPGS